MKLNTHPTRSLAFIVMLLCSLSVASCKQKKEAANGPQATSQNLDDMGEAAVQLSESADSLSAAVADAKSAGDTLLISFSKTPCFGQCPVYKVHVYESGYATYEGINFVDRMGMYATRLSGAEVEELFALAREAGFFGFERTYDHPGLQDLPSTTLMMDGGGKRNHVTIRYDVPRNVKSFFEEMAQRFDARDWQAAGQK